MVLPIYQTTVSTTPSRIVGYDSARTSFLVHNLNSSITVYIGGDPVLTTSNGFPIPAGATIEISYAAGDNPTTPLYAISASSTATVAIFEGKNKNIKDGIQRVQNVNA